MKQLFRYVLLLLATFMGTSAFAADWNIPEPQPSAFVQGDTFAIRNVGLQMFLYKGEAWGTQVCVNTKEDAFAQGEYYLVAPTIDEANADTWGSYYILFDSFGTWGSHRIWRQPGDGNLGTGIKGCFIDNAGNGPDEHLWDIQPVGDNKYTIGIPPTCTEENGARADCLYTEGEFLGVQLDHESNWAASNADGVTYGLYYDVVYADNPANCQWEFFNKKDIDIYNGKWELAHMCDDAAEVDIPTDSYAAIINNPNATIEEVKAAIAELEAKLREADSWNYPQDITEGIIKTPNPYQNHADGWRVYDGSGKELTAANIGSSSKEGDWWIGEFWNASGYSIRQTITVPAGVYTLRCYAMTRDNMNAVLKAGDNQMFIARVPSSTANVRSAAAGLFLKGECQNDISWVQLEDADVEISLTADSETGDHWLPWRNFQLLDRGANMRSYQKAAAALAEGWEEEFIDENGDPRNIFTQDYYDAIADAVASIPTSTNTETALAIYKKVQQSLNDLRENVQLYRWLYLHTVNPETMENPANEPWGLREPFTSVWSEAEEIFYDEDYTKTNEYLRDLKERYIKSRQETIWNIGDEVDRGGDVTIYIENPHFKNDDGTASSFDGWTVGSSSTFQNNAGAIPVIEQWNGSGNTGIIDVSQEITIRKVGAYRLQTKGWYRSTTNEDTHAQEGYNTVNTYLFGASSEYRFHDIYEHPYTPQEKQQYFPKGNIYGTNMNGVGQSANGPGDTDDETYIETLLEDGWEVCYPNNCTGANELFNNPDVNWYDMTCDFLGLGADTPVKIGVRGRDVPGYAWLIWDDFELVFIGDELADMQPIAQQAADAAKEEFPSFDDIEANKAKWDALQNYVAVLENPTDKDALVEAYKNIDNARVALRSSMEAYAKLRKENDKLNDDIIKFSRTAKEDALEAADKLYQEVEDMLAKGTVADEDIDAVIERILDAKNALRFPNNMDEASDENPVDCTALINNPKYYDEGTTMAGWEYEGINNVEAEYDEIGFAEGWGGTPEAATFDIHQTISNLPAGTYKVMVNGVFRQGGVDAERKMSQYEYAEKLGKLDMLNDKAKEDVQVYNGAGQFYGNGNYKPFHRWNYIVTDEWDEVIDIFASTGSYTDGAWVEYVDSVTYGPDELPESYFLPDNRLALYQLVLLGLYDNELYCDVADDGKLTIGACNQNATGLDWTPFSNWRLFYLGTESSHATDAIRETEVATNKIDAIYSIDGRRLNHLQKGMNIVVVNGKAKKIMVK
ncbi:MAG: hypothetical protein IKX44_03190 [Prevotella sp.]|nr:hypothetical protein [Prevotella sp.]